MYVSGIASGHPIGEIILYGGECYAISTDGPWLWRRAADGSWLQVLGWRKPEGS